MKKVKDRKKTTGLKNKVNAYLKENNVELYIKDIEYNLYLNEYDLMLDTNKIKFSVNTYSMPRNLKINSTVIKELKNYFYSIL